MVYQKVGAYLADDYAELIRYDVESCTQALVLRNVRVRMWGRQK